jgi:predicted anti-sigma-YlaC factor YlaD
MVVMNCKVINEFLPDLASGVRPISAEITQHLGHCSGCATQLESLRRTMALLDEWQAPEASAYFDTRLHARMRETAAQSSGGWLAWLRRPALAASVVVLLVGGVSLFYGGRNLGSGSGSAAWETSLAQPGTAVGDLQALDKNHDLYADFDVLDELEVQQDVNP